MTYCTKCGKPTNNGIMCEDCIISDSPWLLAMTRKEGDLVEQIEKLKAENAELREKLTNHTLYKNLEKISNIPCSLGDEIYVITSCCFRCKDDNGDYCSCPNINRNKILPMKVNSIRFDKHGSVLSEDTAGSVGSLSLSCYEYEFGKTWFLTPEEAKTRLRELQGEKHKAEEGKE